MTTFTDNTGHAWQIVLDADALNRVRIERGEELASILDTHADNLNAMRALEIIFAIVRPQAEALGVHSIADFLKRIPFSAIIHVYAALMAAASTCELLPEVTRRLAGRFVQFMQTIADRPKDQTFAADFDPLTCPQRSAKI